ncbi:MAG: SUMF1/EgtB/PvdO family nonheme iron enzyme [Rhodothermales bacterium]
MTEKQSTKLSDKPIVMISSTSRDLPDYRDQVLSACLKAEMFPRMMEDLPASGKDAIEASLAMVDTAEIYIGIFAYRYGYVPDGHNISITQMEYEHAINRGIPILIFIMDESVPVLPKDFDKGDHAIKLEAFKEVLLSKHVIKFFKNPDDLRGQVYQSLVAEQMPSKAVQNIQSTSIPEALQTYLDVLNKQCQVLPLAQLGGHAKQGKVVTLEDVYIGLSTTTQEKQEPHKLAEQEQEQEQEPKYLSAQQVASSETHLVLLGGPGSGKSTFVKQLLAGLISSRQHLDEFLAPVFITLRDLAPRLGQATSSLNLLSIEKRRQKLARLIFEQVVEDLHAMQVAEAEPLLHNAFKSGEIYLVLDGLDEVPFDQRAIVREAVDALLDCHQIKRVIITCRIRSYVQENKLKGFAVHTLAPFTPQQVADFVAGWYHAQTEQSALTSIQADDLTKDLQQAVQSSYLQPLAANPMLLTTMIMVHQEETELPRERVVLYDKAVDILLRKWQQSKGMIPEDLEELFKSQERIRPIIERLAFETHNKGATDTEADLPRPEAIAILEEPTYLGSLAFAGRFLDYVDERSGLLVGRGGSPGRPAAYSFPHRTFQEYLAGCYLVNRRSAVRDIRKLAKEGDFWTVAVQMGAQELLFNRRNQNQLLDNAEKLLTVVKDETGARETLWSAHMAQVVGREQVALDEETGQAYLDEIGQELIKVLSSPLPPIERAEAGRLLAHLGDPRKALLTLGDMAFCYIPPGPFFIADSGVEVHLPTPYWIGKNPVTQAQFNLFRADGGYEQEKWWTEDGWDYIYKQDRNAPRRYREPFNLSNHPVVGVSWYEAYAFTQWLTSHCKEAGWIADEGQIALPSSPQWEKAARGGHQIPESATYSLLTNLQPSSSREVTNPFPNRKYPWGDEITANKCNYRQTGIGATSTPGCFQNGTSPYGVEELSGNVLEWCQSKYEVPQDIYTQAVETWKPYEEAAGNEPRVLRGGSFVNADSSVRCAYRFRISPNFRYDSVGFRIVALPKGG